jgi:hypothetical protein
VSEIGRYGWYFWNGIGAGVAGCGGIGVSGFVVRAGVERWSEK